MVAHASNSHANGKSPAHSAFQMYFGGLEALGQAYDPFLKGIGPHPARGARFRQPPRPGVHADPGRLPRSAARRRILSTCRSQFWRAAYEDYTESVGRVTNALAACGVPNFATLAEEALNNAHDYIAFPEPKEQPAAAAAHASAKPA